MHLVTSLINDEHNVYKKILRSVAVHLILPPKLNFMQETILILDFGSQYTQLIAVVDCQ